MWYCLKYNAASIVINNHPQLNLKYTAVKLHVWCKCGNSHSSTFAPRSIGANPAPRRSINSGLSMRSVHRRDVIVHSRLSAVLMLHVTIYLFIFTLPECRMCQ